MSIDRHTESLFSALSMASTAIGTVDVIEMDTTAIEATEATEATGSMSGDGPTKIERTVLAYRGNDGNNILCISILDKGAARVDTVESPPETG